MLTALHLSMNLAGSMEASLRTEARLRVSDETSAAASLEVEAAPELRASLSSRRMRYALAYTPRATLLDTSSGSERGFVLHEGAAHVAWRGRQSLLSLDERASYGDVNLASLALVPGADGGSPRVDPLPAAGALALVSSMTTLASRRTGRRWSLDASIGYELSGGADARAREVLPYQSGPFAGVGLDYALSRQDHAVTTVSASETRFSSGPESLLAGVGQGLRHRFSRVTEVRVAVGVTGARARLSEGAPHDFDAYPTAEATLDHDAPALDGRAHVQLGLRIAPVVNRLLGLVDERLEASVAARLERGRFTTSGFVSASTSVPASSAIATGLLAGELAESYDVSDAVSLSTGVRASWQGQESAQITAWQGIAFFGVTLRAPPTPF